MTNRIKTKPKQIYPKGVRKLMSSVSNHILRLSIPKIKGAHQEAKKTPNTANFNSQ